MKRAAAWVVASLVALGAAAIATAWTARELSDESLIRLAVSAQRAPDRIQAAEALAAKWQDRPQEVQALFRSADDQRWNAGYIVATRLRRLTPATEQALLDSIEGNEERRRLAARLLSELPTTSPSVLDFLVETARSDDTEAAAIAIDGLRGQGPGSVTRLSALATDAPPRVALKVLSGLYEKGWDEHDREAVLSLAIEFGEHSNRLLQERAVALLAMQDEEAAALELARLLRAAEAVTRRVAAQNATTHARHPTVAAALTKALDDSNPHVRFWALAAWHSGRRPPAEVQLVLRRAAEDDDDDVRWLAGRLAESAS